MAVNSPKNKAKIENQMTIEVRNNNVERALRVLKRKLTEDGLFKEIQAHSFYEKPSEARRRRHRLAVARHRREVADRVALQE